MHQQREKVKVVIGQLGSPERPTAKALRPYLRDFLGDPRVVDLPPLLWKIILYAFVLPFRPKRSAQAYARIWDEDSKSFPLVSITKDLAEKIEKKLPPWAEVNYAFLLGHPQIEELFSQWDQEDEWDRAQSVLVLPQFPQYSESTIAAVVDKLGASLGNRVNIPHLHFISFYHRAKCFIDLSVKQIENYLQEWEQKGVPSEELVLSFHGIPLRRVLEKKDLYYRHCFETFWLIKTNLKHPLKEKMHLCFQSRFGSEQWLGPATDDYVCDLVKSGSKRIAIYCPSFTVDCLETIDEIGTELQEEVEEDEGHIQFIPCLNDDPEWVEQYASFIQTHLEGSAEQRDQLYYEVPREKVEQEMPAQHYWSPPLSKEAKKTTSIMFLTIFLDIVGFSIIFPLFPELAKYYLTLDPDNMWLQAIFAPVTWWTQFSPNPNAGSIVLFGGVMGALYAILQFLFAPFWGMLSDRIGRRPVLLVSLVGLTLSYVFWIFAGTFGLLIAGRFLGGIMAGNISTASAVVADVTTEKNRSKGMAFIGIGFALGFIFGPALGGLLSLVRLDLMLPSFASYGLNPFSVPALLAFLLGALNVFLVATKFKETLPEEKRGKRTVKRTANPLRLFGRLPFPGVNQTNIAYFLFISAFSGMEFTLTFLAVERLSFTPLDNGKMFIFIGLLIALVQGGYVRRKASLIGERVVAMRGLVILLPGLILLGLAYQTWMLYAGLFFLAVGSGMIVPTITSLISLYTPPEQQGEALGVFRSLGSLGRVIGPILASILYWQFGSGFPYFTGAAFLIVPVLLVKLLPRPKTQASP